MACTGLMERKVTRKSFRAMQGEEINKSKTKNKVAEENLINKAKNKDRGLLKKGEDQTDH